MVSSIMKESARLAEQAHILWMTANNPAFGWSLEKQEQLRESAREADKKAIELSSIGK